MCVYVITHCVCVPAYSGVSLDSLPLSPFLLHIKKIVRVCVHTYCCGTASTHTLFAPPSLFLSPFEINIHVCVCLCVCVCVCTCIFWCICWLALSPSLSPAHLKNCTCVCVHTYCCGCTSTLSLPLPLSFSVPLK